MNILHTIRSIDPNLGGPIEGIKQFASVSTKLGHDVEVLSLDAPDAPFVKRFPLPVHCMGPGAGLYGFGTRFVPWLAEHAREYDVVIVNGIWQYHSFGSWRALHKSETPYVVFTHGMLDPWFKRTYPLKHLKKWMYWPWAEYRVLRDATSVMFTCEEERVLARQSFSLYQANEIVVPYGTTGPSGDSASAAAAFTSRFPELRGKKIALFMGRIHPKKGCDVALRAFAESLAPDPSWRLVMAGPDPIGWQSDLQDLATSLKISDRITWTGMVTGDLKWGAIHSSEVLFLPSHQENFGIVVAEALACGVPVLISDKVNIWREVQSEGAGLVTADTVAGASSLLRSWDSLAPANKSLMRTDARKCFERHFDLVRATERFLQVLAHNRRHTGSATQVQLRDA